MGRATPWLLAAGALVGGGLYGVRLAPRWLEVVRLRVGVPGLAAELEGLRIAHLSDFHAGGRNVSLQCLQAARHAALAFEPDLVALTGDFYDGGIPVEVDGLFGDWPDGVPVVGVLGNHDSRGGAERLCRLVAELERSGVQLLRNEAASVFLRGQEVWLVGVDDPHSWQADEARAFDGLPDDVEALLYLAHSPAGVTRMPVGRARLVLAGHTHGGQLRVVRSGRVPLAATVRRLTGEPPKNDPPFHRGCHWIRGAVVVVSNGLGVTRVPVRLFTRPQVVLLELTRAGVEGDACDVASRYVERLNPGPRLLRWLA